jgi:hypothetical protein
MPAVALRRRVALATIIASMVLGFVVLRGTEPATAYNVCSGGACVHEYMADQALQVIPEADRGEIDDFMTQIKAGITHEDEHDHTYGLAQSSLVTATHFWDADLGDESPANNADEYFLGEFPNSWQEMRALWLRALGHYHDGNKAEAYHYLGHVIHHLEDNTVPAHVHDDPHPNVFPDITGGFDDDAYHVWMDVPGAPGEPANAKMKPGELDALKGLGPIDTPAGDIQSRLRWLLYSTNQIADHFASDDFDGDDNGIDASVMADAGYPSLPNKPTNKSDLYDNDGCIGPGGTICTDSNNDSDGDLSAVRQYSYLRGIRAVSSMMLLFEEASKQSISLVVSINRIRADQDNEGLDEECVWVPIPVPPFKEEVCAPGGSPADLFARVTVHGYESRTRGDSIENTDDITPNPRWVFGNVTGTTGVAKVRISVEDHDGLYDDLVTTRGSDDVSDIDSTGGEDDMVLELDVDLGKCLRGEAGAITGDDFNAVCGTELTQKGDHDEHESQVWFTIQMSESPPTADAGGPYTTNEGTNVTLDGTGSSDPDNNIAAYAWDLDGDGACDDVANDSTPDFTAVGQDGVTNIKLCVTDAAGLTDDDTTTVTVNNVAPSVTLGSDSPNDENAVTTVSGIISDPGWLDPLTATIDWGDGGGAVPLGGTYEGVRPDATLSFNATHVYGDNGTFVVTVCARDDDSAPVCQSTSVQVDNVRPTAAIDLSGAALVNGVQTLILHAGDGLALTARSTDPGSDDLTLTWDWGDGTPVTSTTYLVSPPNPDPLLSPTIQPRDVSESQTHAYAAACTYVITFTVTDDDGGTSTATANVLVVGNGKRPSGDGYWRHQFRTHITGKGASDFDADTLGCYLEIVGYMSAVFNETTTAATLAEAEDILFTNSGPTGSTERFDKDLLTAWLNFADGTIEWDSPQDLDKDGVYETTFLGAMAQAEAVRLNPASTAAQLRDWRSVVATLR